MKILIIGEPDPRSNLQTVLKECLPDIEFSIALDASTLDQCLSQDGYDLVFIEKPLDRLSSHDLVQSLGQKRETFPLLFVSPFEETDAYFRAILDGMPDWLEWLGSDGRYRFVSSACETVTGYPPEDFIANPDLCIELVHPDDFQRLTQHHQETQKHSTRSCEFEFRLIHRNGELRWINHKCRPLYREGAWIGHFASNRDITEQKQAAEEHYLGQQAMLTLMNAPSDVIILVDRQYKIVHANQVLADRFGKRLDEIVGKYILDVLPLSSGLAQSRAAITRRVFETGQPARSEDIGVSGVYDNAYFPVFDDKGIVRLVAVIARDITQHKQVENELRQSYQTIQALLNAPSDVAVVFDLEGRIQMANETLARILNLPLHELVGNILWDYFPVEIADARKAVVEKVKLTRKSERVIDRGVLGLYDSILQPILDDSGNITRFALLARDISDQIKAQQTISQREAMLTTIVNNAPVVMFVFDKDGNITFADGKAISVATQLNEQLIGLNILDFPATNQVFVDGLHQALNGQDYASQITTSSGYTFETTAYPATQSGWRNHRRHLRGRRYYRESKNPARAAPFKRRDAGDLGGCRGCSYRQRRKWAGDLR